MPFPRIFQRLKRPGEPSAGETIKIDLRQTSVSFFDAEDGKRWHERQDIELFEHLVISLTAIAHAQSESGDDLGIYAGKLPEELRESLRDRAARILAVAEMRVAKEAREEAQRAEWFIAARHGLSTYLDDFSIGMRESFGALQEQVAKSMGFRDQFKTALYVAFALAVIIGASKFAITAYDDIFPHQTIETRK